MISPAATDIVRGTMRLLLDLDLASLPEFTLATGRRVDLMALGRDARLVAIEVKSCRTDFLTDRYAAGVIRPAQARSIAAGRRRSLLLRFARTAALRLQGAADPAAEAEPG